jgi:hypothetical protein
VPILNEGMENGRSSPLSRPMVAPREVRGSSSKMRRGRDTRMYCVGILAIAVRGAPGASGLEDGWQQRLMGKVPRCSGGVDVGL